MSVDTDPFPTATVNMVDAHLPKDKGKGKAEAVTTQHFLNQNPWPHFTVDFRSNKPPTVLTGPAIVKPMTEYSTDEEGWSALLCRKCKANVNTEPKEKLSPTIVEQPTASTQQKVLNVGQHQGVFYRLGPKVQVEENLRSDGALILMPRFMTKIITSVILAVQNHRRAKKTFKPPEPRD
ncbi:hypothetical protein ACFX12_000056 [Malus domestica]